MKAILTSVFLFVITVSMTAQTESLQGKILNNFNEPLAGVNVLIKESSKGSNTDFDGKFIINDLQKGDYTIVISSIGYKTKELNVTIPSSELEIILFEGTELLQEVVVSSRKNNFSRKETAYVSKLPLKDLDNSHVYSTVTTELLESQVITNIDDALINATGVSKLWEATGRDPLKGTGYFSTRGFSTQPQMVNGLPGVTLSAIDPSYIERIEVIKGPSATLFGSTFTSLGGLINVVTKKPYKGTGGSVSYTGGSFGTHRISLDVNTALNKKENMYFRLNSSYLTQDSFQDAGFRKTFFVAPSLTYRVNNRLNLSAGLEYSWTRQTNASMLFLRRGLPLVSTNIEELNVDPNKSLTSDDVYLTSPSLTTRAIADYKLSDNWTSQTIFAGNFGESKGFYQYNIDGGAVAILSLQELLADPALAPLQPVLAAIVTPMLLEAGSLLQTEAFTRIFDKRDARAKHINFQQNFTGDFKLGTMRNRMVIGLDYVVSKYNYKNKSGNPVITSTSNFPQLLGTLNSIPQLAPTAQYLEAFYSNLPYFDAFFDAQGNVIPTSFTPGATTNITNDGLEAIFDQIPARNDDFKSSTFAAYVSDVINLTEQLTFNVGLRLDYFNQDGDVNNPDDGFTKTTFSPNAGIIYQPIKDQLSLFTNYQTGFINNDPVFNPTTGGYDTWEPTKANQFEVGVKTNLVKGKLNIGASYYNIKAEDRIGTDPRGLLLPVSVPIDEIVSQGLELEVNASPFAGLNLRASYAYNDSKITEVSIPELLDRRPEEAGPESVYNFWADYKFKQGSALEKFGIGAGFNGASSYNTMDNGISGQFELPSYTVFNSSIYYNTQKFRVGLKINNITDNTYYKGWSTINPQAPRAFLATIGYKF